MNNPLEMIWKEAVMAYFKVISPAFSWRQWGEP
jgi:hypothetical protein